MIEIKLTEEAKRLQEIYPMVSFTPTRMTPKACGYDIRYCGAKDVILAPQEEFKLPTGFHAKVVDPLFADETISLAAVILPRSSINGIMLTNTVGLGDMEEYEGQYFVKVFNRTEDIVTIKAFERIAQVLFIPCYLADFKEVEQFSTLDSRGEGGFGSTGRV